MIRTQIYITAKERAVLDLLVDQTHKTQSELIREAIDFYGEKQLGKNRVAILKTAKGLWKSRNDLPDFTSLRKEFDRLVDKEK